MKHEATLSRPVRWKSGIFWDVFQVSSEPTRVPFTLLEVWSSPRPEPAVRHFVRLCSFSAQKAETQPDVGESGQVVEGD